MAQVDKNDILEISEEFETVYADVVDELLINIAKHFDDPNNQRTVYWEIQKLSEIGALTEESIEIISQKTNILPEQIRARFYEVARSANIDINPQLKEAIEKGLLSGEYKSMEASPYVNNVLNDYSNQAIDKMNLVNTTMLQSTIDAFNGVIKDISLYESNMNSAQQIVDSATGMLINNTVTRQKAFKYALDKLADKGITGFVDRIGRNWSPEAYVAMIVRTTAHNVGIESVKQRMAEYGSDIFQVSAHSGCRPSHYKFQDNFYSWQSPSGTFVDGLGVKHKYTNIQEVPADDKYNSIYPSAGAIFGINCSHYPIPMIAGLTIPRERVEESKEESDKLYSESQQQRALERRIRKEKLQYEMDKIVGADEEALKQDRARIREAQQEIRKFIDETGRVRRYDREGGYNINKAVNINSERIIKEAQRRYPTVTNDLESAIKDNNSTIFGGVKGQGSTSRKLITKSAEKGLTVEGYSQKVTDILRYTQLSSTKELTQDYFSTVSYLEQNGYNMVEVTNTFPLDESYRGINTLVSTPDGYVFELQFHTQQSLDVKEINHKMYEEQRKPTTSEARKKELDKIMMENAKSIPMPIGVESITDV